LRNVVSGAYNFRREKPARKRPQHGFTSVKLKPESGANRINRADDAYSFLAHMQLSYQNRPHWQAARQALNNVGASDAGEVQVWRSFRAAAAAEGWLVE
jgi:hypothetical protein